MQLSCLVPGKGHPFDCDVHLGPDQYIEGFMRRHGLWREEFGQRNVRAVFINQQKDCVMELSQQHHNCHHHNQYNNKQCKYQILQDYVTITSLNMDQQVPMEQQVSSTECFEQLS